ncbi:hypothetical protein ANS017_21420 [Paraclostridium bifermentans]|uniref:hypothetical protein n=1 Tax=Paraclostridium bifermentans TaxID=1490 RepID=UPI0021C26952|nr:hypothetical protein [Paraclostridium bifermentans]GKZ04269.1 hypothetical protein ANS014_27030 [Paraclostridium bifermentans]GKZ06106.1 hypothetical protein ANS015_09890 [Paraclostridium bifermentans]GKZ10758.1 hypothetical protein ANS017_21420 [Paraclostridium bifermentans]
MKINEKQIIDATNRIINNNEFLSDIADEYDVYPNSLLTRILRDKECKEKLASFISSFIDKDIAKEEDLKKGIIKEIKKVGEDIIEANTIIHRFTNGESLTKIAKDNYKSKSTYTKFLNRMGYKFDKKLGYYTHEDDYQMEEAARIMSSADIEEEIEYIFDKRYYEFDSEKGCRLAYENFYRLKTIDTGIYHSLYKDLEKLSDMYGLDDVNDLIHLILLRFVDKEDKKDLSNEYDLQELNDMGYNTKEEIDILLNHGLNYECDELYDFYRYYLESKGLSKDWIEGLDYEELYLKYKELY